MPKTKYIKSLFPQERIDDTFIVTQKQLGVSKNGNKYLTLRLTDKTGDIDAKKWDTSENEAMSITEGGYYVVRGLVNEFNGSLQIRVDSLAKSSENLDPSDFMKSSPRDLQEMQDELKDYIKSVTDENASKLLKYFFDDIEFFKKFSYAPAAKSMHHGYISGLIQHTLEVCKIAESFATIYPFLNRDVLICGCIFHDVAKITEYSFNGGIEFTAEGHLIGHLVKGAMMVKEGCDKLKLDEVFAMHMEHMILSHHGKLEWGSPKRPKSLEAILLNEADLISATVVQFMDAVTDSTDISESLFTKNAKTFDRRLFKGYVIKDTQCNDEDEKDEFDSFDDFLNFK